MNKYVLGAQLVIAMVLCTSASAQVAPQLSYLQAVAVASDRYPNYEMIADSQLLTSRDHGVRQLVVVTKEIGYASPSSLVATFGGKKMKEALTERIVSGGKIIGYYRYWLYEGSYTTGTFKYTASSVNFPYKAMSDQLVIK